MKYEIVSEEGKLVLHTFQDSVDMVNSDGEKITLDWDEIHWLVDILPKAIKDAIATYW